MARGVAEGLTSREAGERPCISTNTVRAHVRHIFTKLDRSRVERARVVLETVGYSRSEVVGRLNPVLRGRGAYFRRGHSSRVDVVEAHVHERLAIFASNKHGLPGRNWGRRFTTAWFHSLGVYRLSGTIRRATPHASR